MKIVVDIDEDELMEQVKQIVSEKIASRILDEYHNSSERRCYRNVIKECVREAIKSDIDNLSDRAVKAASVSITNKGLKKVSTEELLARIAGRDGE